MIITFFVSITFYSIFIIRRSFDCKLIIITFSSSSLSPAYPSSERLYVEVPDIDHFLPSSSLSGVFVIIWTFDHPRHEQHLKLSLALKLYTSSDFILYTFDHPPHEHEQHLKLSLALKHEEPPSLTSPVHTSPLIKPNSIRIEENFNILKIHQNFLKKVSITF